MRESSIRSTTGASDTGGDGVRYSPLVTSATVPQTAHGTGAVGVRAAWMFGLATVPVES